MIIVIALTHVYNSLTYILHIRFDFSPFISFTDVKENLQHTRMNFCLHTSEQHSKWFSIIFVLNAQLGKLKLSLYHDLLK